MPTIPPILSALLRQFAPLVSRRVWPQAHVLLLGAILAPGRRTVSAVLRVMGLAHIQHFQRYHRVLNRAVWSSRAMSQTLLRLLVAAFAPDGPLILGLDETIERRWGKQIAAKGRYRDPVRSTHAQWVMTSGVRWVCLMLLTPIPWAGRVWARPFLTALAPSERSNRQRGHRHRPVIEWGRQLILLVRRWYPDRSLVVVADGTSATIALLQWCQQHTPPITRITRLRLDAAVYEPAPPRRPGQRGRPRVKGKRLPTLATRLHDPATAWQPVMVASWHGGEARVVEVASDTAVW